MIFAHLNQPDLSPDAGSDAYRRVLARLGDDIATIAAQLQLRLTAATRIDSGGRYILVRLTTPGEHVVVRVAPDGDLAAELFFARALAQRHIPTQRVIHADISRSQFPFAYMVEAYVGGVRGDALAEPHLLRGAARQLGRVFRRIHAIPTPGWGRPGLRRTWSAESWGEALAQLSGAGASDLAARLVFGEELPQQIASAVTVADAPPEPRLLHGALNPASMIVTPGEQAQLVAVNEPGPIIGGDPLLDLARVLDPNQPAAFREGFLGGYLASALSEEEQRRLQRLRLLDSFLAACRNYMLAEPYQEQAAVARSLLAELTTPNNAEE